MIFLRMYLFSGHTTQNVAGFGDYANSQIAMYFVVFYNPLLLHVFLYIYNGIIIANIKVVYMPLVLVIVSRSCK